MFLHNFTSRNSTKFYFDSQLVQQKPRCLARSLRPLYAMLHNVPQLTEHVVKMNESIKMKFKGKGKI